MKFSREWDNRFLELAKHISTWSKDPSTQTGAVIVRPNGTIASTGFNGFPQLMADKKEWLDNREEKYSRIIHCEMNALLFCREPVNGYTLYTYPFSSCERCFIHMVQAGIIRFVFPPVPKDKDRWEASFQKVRQYAFETGVMLHQLDTAMATKKTTQKVYHSTESIKRGSI